MSVTRLDNGEYWLERLKKNHNALETQLCVLQMECHTISVAKGWYEKDNGYRNPGELIALIHSELSEALEALRDGNKPDKNLPDHNSLAVELADAVIRIFDMAAYMDCDLPSAIIDKMEYNKTRPARHGGKAF